MERYTEYPGVDVYWTTDTHLSAWAWDWTQHHGTITTEHAAACYDQPVVVVQTGQVYGPGELAGIMLKITVAPTYTTPLIEAARTAGYQVHSDGWRLGPTPPAMINEMLA